MSNPDYITPEDRPEYTPGDLVEIFNPEIKADEWLEVEEVLRVGSALILLSRGRFFSSCLVKVGAVWVPRLSRPAKREEPSPKVFDVIYK
jgi:hypothetical protein